MNQKAGSTVAYGSLNFFPYSLYVFVCMLISYWPNRVGLLCHSASKKPVSSRGRRRVPINKKVVDNKSFNMQVSRSMLYLKLLLNRKSPPPRHSKYCTFACLIISSYFPLVTSVSRFSTRSKIRSSRDTSRSIKARTSNSWIQCEHSMGVQSIVDDCG